MTLSQYEISPARLEDTEVIGKLRAENWYEQYNGVQGIDPEWVSIQTERTLNPANTEQRAKAVAESQQPNAHNFWRVVRPTLGSAVVGFVHASKLDDGSQELHSLHVANGHRDHGIGQVLVDAAHEWFDQNVPVFLDVARDNHRAQAFYKREPNSYYPTDHTYTFELLSMIRLQRDPWIQSLPSSDSSQISSVSLSEDSKRVH